MNGLQRYISLNIDEIKIQQNLVYDKHNNELIGYVNLGDPTLIFLTFDDCDELASHILVFYIRGLLCDFEFAMAYFATKTATSYQIFPLFWDAVSILEGTCNLQKITVVSDGAAPNRKFYRLHRKLDNEPDCDVVYRTVNLFAPERFIWFFADAPHLMKTTRNCLSHSGK